MNSSENIEVKASKRKLQSSIALRAKRMVRENKVYKEAEIEFNNLKNDPFFLAGVCLYWAKGGKESGYFQFSTFDRSLSILMVKWMKKYLKVSEKMIKIKKYNQIPKITGNKSKKNEYVRILVTRIDILRKVIAWQKLLIKYYEDASNK